MGRGYSTADLREKLISILQDSETGMSGVEIAEKVDVNRITMTKYLKVFAAEGLLRQKNIGNITLWFLEPGQESFVFPDDYFRIEPLYMDYLLKGTEDQVYSLVRNCINSDAKKNRLIFEVILPVVDSINNLFDDGKIGTSELNLHKTTISKSLQIFNHLPVVSDPKKNIIIIAGDAQSLMFSEAASALYHTEGWRVFNLGDMSSAINVLFDLDFQKLVGKVWKQKPGILTVLVFSQTSEGLNFFADSINPLKEKSGKNMKLVLCGKVPKKTKIKAEFISRKFEEVFQWTKTISENLK